ncbi:response regulator transcription factor [Paenibacillus sp. N1-5-1-14]|uniref:response regulator transcription factor n=1 Tax=Paenibacillus radicibacter TaxID=2972488 RepID=UPI0021597684|nr:response regulator transcription factor [Paenibacillus radicibacter]MCR8642724.1 response regulator transcription factor [Paenibacillus radicibacter]
MERKVLVIEDKAILREMIVDYFHSNDYQVIEAADGLQGITLFDQSTVDLVILDIMMPKLDGWEVCRHIRQHSSVPIIMLTARSDEEDALHGYELGADDYVTKPFSPSVLVAKANTLLRRIQGTKHTKDRIELADIGINRSTRIVTVDDQEINLTHTEFEILDYLMENQGHVMTRESLVIHIWGYDYEGDDRTISTHIRNLRSKLGIKANHIVTVFGSGYKFEVQP